ncbi:Cysteine/Histidine-rich C1 domain family protein [Arabidopsis thaliana]|uniref:Cysteine/Histidine-rich C1 domain family protein n=2 Tax=Arabidopsis thaliana TaxID=3702 RepID=F4JIJ2_ARATH|nr:Cysteine/Histidine-rich C1 domain family protein [Arabidopsis thaliana]AEE83533.1 Cysteine/Histidine-rich C1 domain family protein [Arabidopsis thaliana]|eukprot:NP_193234.4 Cysteine/Histidine-rich C1 domain family protein [Arabidopsis thaliana]
MLSTESEIETRPNLLVPLHEHPLSCTEEFIYSCDFCNSRNGIAYQCTECGYRLHKDCIQGFLSYPSPCGHSLKISMPNKSPQYANDRCHFCLCKLKTPFARCTVCNINISPLCMVKQPPLTICNPKHHKHSLTLLVRLVIFTCNACGVEGDRNPYVCLQCNLMVHKDCIENLPRVICINRHDHRIFHTFHLGQREEHWECGVCRKTVDWVYGAFKCSRCPNYAVHSRCATKKEVWDGIELEDVPEEEEEVEEPFVVINEKEIIHFSHEEHVLRLDENYVTDNVNMRCRGCVLAINGDSCYKCVECDYILHKACASLPRKKRHLLHNHKLTLQVDEAASSDFVCTACRTYSNGFRYKCFEGCEDDVVYDVRCSSVSEPFQHDLHPHPLYWTLESSKRCQACGTETDDNLLNCTVCDDYALCMKCATLPRKVKHRCDDHFLSLCQGVGNASGNLWCDICETKTDPNVCYYTCEECGLSLHLNCVLGDFYYVKVIPDQPKVFANNGVTRLFCGVCEVRCKFPFIMWGAVGDFTGYVCSINCVFPKADK